MESDIPYTVRLIIEDYDASNDTNGYVSSDITAYQNDLIASGMARLFSYKGFYFYEIDLKKYAKYAAGVSFEFNQSEAMTQEKTERKLEEIKRELKRFPVHKFQRYFGFYSMADNEMVNYSGQDKICISINTNITGAFSTSE